MSIFLNRYMARLSPDDVKESKDDMETNIKAFDEHMKHIHKAHGHIAEAMEAINKFRISAEKKGYKVHSGTHNAFMNQLSNMSEKLEDHAEKTYASMHGWGHREE